MAAMSVHSYKWIYPYIETYQTLDCSGMTYFTQNMEDHFNCVVHDAADDTLDDSVTLGSYEKYSYLVSGDIGKASQMMMITMLATIGAVAQLWRG
jgi:hypothetical protein